MNKFQYNSEPYKLLVGLYIWSNFYRRPSYVSYIKKKLTVKIIDQQTHKPQKQNFVIHNTTQHPECPQFLALHKIWKRTDDLDLYSGILLFLSI